MISQKPLVSIIIPTYNRCHFIGKTLDSIICQTYSKWECIVIDDGSQDYTSELMGFYLENDVRISYFFRPDGRLKGANACRNYGLEICRGEFVNWFDSDDLMMPNNIQLKLESIGSNFDFVVGKSINFNEVGEKYEIFDFNYNIEINAESFINGTIGWITNDVLIKKQAIQIKFRENLKSGQEYNFFSRLLYYTNNGCFLNDCTVLRRIHSESIQEKLKNDPIEKNSQDFFNEHQLLKDIAVYANNKTIRRSLIRMIRYSYLGTKKFSLNKNQYLTLSSLNNHRYILITVYYFVWIILNLFSGKGYFLIAKITRRLL